MHGEVVSYYRVLEQLGRGGMGVVHRAEDLRLGRQVALKFLATPLATDAESIARFEREARAASALNHPNICTIYQIDTNTGRPFIAMELLEGRTLDDLIDGRPVAVDDIVRLGAEIADALAAAHAKGLVHRDIKPANVFVTSGGHAKVLDFGLAKAATAVGASELATLPAELTVAGMTPGTVAYMSPEQARGENVDARTDLFSLGAVLYEMATGRRAFVGDSVALLFDAILNRTPAAVELVNRDVHAGLAAVIAKALEKDRRWRYQSAEDLRTDLERIGRERANTTALQSAPSRPAHTGWTRWRIVIPAVAALAVVIAVALTYFPRAQALTDADPVVLADLTNATGNPVFDGALKIALAIKLEESPFINLVPEQRVRETLREMLLSPESPLTDGVAKEVCQRLNASAVIGGSVSELGGRYLVSMNAEDCRTGASLGREQAEASAADRLLNALGEASSRLRRKLGESLTSVDRFDTPLQQASTSSFEALKAYSMAFSISLTEGGSVQSSTEAQMPFYKRAVELDPDFAMAHRYLGVMYLNLGEGRAGREHIVRAYNLRDRLSERERLSVIGSRELWVRGDLPQAIDAGEVWTRTYPRDSEAWTHTAWARAFSGQFEAALAADREAFRLKPSAIKLNNLARRATWLGQFDEANALLDHLVARNSDSVALRRILYQVAFAKEDTGGMERQAHAVRKLQADLEPVLREIDQFSGKLKLTRSHVEQETARLLRLGRRESAARTASALALFEAYVGEHTVATVRAQRALAIMRSPDTLANAGLALAISGALPRAEALASELERLVPTNTRTREVTVPIIRAVIEVRRGNPVRAVELLSRAAPYDRHVWPCVYARAEAYLAAGAAADAVREFHKIVDNRGLGLTQYLYPLAQRGLARAHAAAGDRESSRKAYARFFSFWSQADGDLPILQQARQERARLE